MTINAFCQRNSEHNQHLATCRMSGIPIVNVRAAWFGKFPMSAAHENLYSLPLPHAEYNGASPITIAVSCQKLFTIFVAPSQRERTIGVYDSPIMDDIHGRSSASVQHTYHRYHCPIKYMGMELQYTRASPIIYTGMKYQCARAQYQDSMKYMRVRCSAQQLAGPMMYDYEWASRLIAKMLWLWKSLLIFLHILLMNSKLLVIIRLKCKTVTTTVKMTVSEKRGYSAQVLNF